MDDIIEQVVDATVMPPAPDNNGNMSVHLAPKYTARILSLKVDEEGNVTLQNKQQYRDVKNITLDEDGGITMLLGNHPSVQEMIDKSPSGVGTLAIKVYPEDWLVAELLPEEEIDNAFADTGFWRQGPTIDFSIGGFNYNIIQGQVVDGPENSGTKVIRHIIGHDHHDNGSGDWMSAEGYVYLMHSALYLSPTVVQQHATLCPVVTEGFEWSKEEMESNLKAAIMMRRLQEQSVEEREAEIRARMESDGLQISGVDESGEDVDVDVILSD